MCIHWIFADKFQGDSSSQAGMRVWAIPAAW